LCHLFSTLNIKAGLKVYCTVSWLVRVYCVVFRVFNVLATNGYLNVKINIIYIHLYCLNTKYIIIQITAVIRRDCRMAGSGDILKSFSKWLQSAQIQTNMCTVRKTKTGTIDGIRRNKHRLMTSKHRLKLRYIYRDDGISNFKLVSSIDFVYYSLL